MEYSESVINGGVTYGHKCAYCGNEKHHVKGAIKYTYLILESLPLFPVGKSVRLECTECLHIAERQDMASELYQKLSGSVFTIYHFLLKFLGVFLIAYGAYYWYQADNAHTLQTEKIVSYPQINDFMMIDYRHLSDDLRPHQRYRVAKVVDLTGDTVSLAVGNFYYRHESSFRDAIASGQTRAFNYFGKNHLNLRITKLNALYEAGGVTEAARPEGNMLFGNFVINDTGYRVGATYIPGEREYASGLAFEEANYLQDHEVEAFQRYEKSANMGFSLAQMKLAEYYMAGEVVEPNFHKALYWLESASLQSNERAVKKFTIVCSQTKGCDVNAFYQRLLDNGVNLTVNHQGKPFID
ncbi:hypothetical protein ACFSJY_14395 [Thalassotalea euphylliae]|uniref:hypothetical protein n=1 Tax=Thalassotalea euphylliae TaxID=1655234 RepID=UPI00362D16DC